MEVFAVTGGARLAGEVAVSGAKNSVLKLMAASLLAEGTTHLGNVPQILDVSIMSEVLRRLGCQVDEAEGTLQIAVPGELSTETDYQLVRRMRASIAVLGPMVARFGRAKVALPGGDAIGARGLDYHVAGLSKLGADVRSEHGYLIAEAERLRGERVHFEFPSVGATENILMAAVLAKGTTVIENAAREPEIVDLTTMLQAMGAQIDGVGTTELVIDGVDELHPVSHETVPDRIVAGTWAIASVLTRGDVRVRRARPEHSTVVLSRLEDIGAQIREYDDGFAVSMDRRPTALDVATLPYPGFPTDLQPMMLAVHAISDGSAILSENVFEARFMFAGELVRLGADIIVDGHHCLTRGVPALSGAPVQATDIRAGAALVLAGLIADGVTEVAHIYHIDRGYVAFDEQLRSLGAQIERVKVADLEFGE
ncbi:UDP-N-acetylglucosamine 1-carboxyvinyltransferase [Epidermidibacterium keratini]|uniref:UDP-N-acetylglucosamine 1-carboxyvinyltransferase n=1 Tax=Epidermidibacterium keratini TaxID=1891644 RepID=A0A7L4YRL0_9ACTN|nr:UDP-N-acetylglucosamine 1-carboxyvinyltransferase [Epidermidibacterium keratini]QHC01712.1 UDP-N-acetylglucosamine 1-carboxyvinyltransferase [Epidermidibacterium keratini]